MKMKFKLFIALVTMILCLQSCDPKTEITSDDLSIKATNLTEGDGKLSANGASPFTNVNWSITITINGESTIVSGTKNSNELPVKAGDEIEITFTPTNSLEKEARVSFPDGVNNILTPSSPSVKWIVPSNFQEGMEIKGECSYETDATEYHKTGIIRLINLFE